MKIGIIGSGNMGRVIGLALSGTGHEVFFGARNNSQAKFASSFDNNTRWGSNQEAAEFGKLIYFSPRNVHPNKVLDDIEVLDDKIVIESNNWALSNDFSIDPIIKSKSEVLQEQLPNAKVVKAFNTITQELFNFSENNLELFDIACFIASNDPSAVEVVAKLVKEIGFSPIDCGALKQSRLIEAMGGMLRILLRKQKTPWLSFRIQQTPQLKNFKYGGRTQSKLHGENSYLKETE